MKSYFKNKMIISIIFSFTISSFLIVVFLYGKCSTQNICSLQKQNNEAIFKKLNEINSDVMFLKNKPSTTKEQQLILKSIENKISLLNNQIIEVA